MLIALSLAQQGSGGTSGAILGVLVLLPFLAFVWYQVFKFLQKEANETLRIESLPPSIQHVVLKMDDDAQLAFFNEYESKKKTKSTGWLMFFVGWHYLYVGKVGLQFAYWLTFGGFLFWALADLFRMPSIIRAANEQIARDAIKTLGVAATFQQQTAPGVGA